MISNNQPRGCRNFDASALVQMGELEDNTQQDEWAEMGWVMPSQAPIAPVEKAIDWRATILGWIDIGVPVILMGGIWRVLWCVLVKGWRPLAWASGGDSPWRGPLCWVLVASMVMTGAFAIVGWVEYRRGDE